MCLEACKSYGSALMYIKNPTEEMCLEALKKDGTAIRFIKNPTEKMCSIATKQNPKASTFVRTSVKEMPEANVTLLNKIFKNLKNLIYSLDSNSKSFELFEQNDCTCLSITSNNGSSVTFRVDTDNVIHKEGTTSISNNNLQKVHTYILKTVESLVKNVPFPIKSIKACNIRDFSSGIIRKSPSEPGSVDIELR